MTEFFIEFRFHGYAKRRLKRLVWEVARKFRVRGAIKERPVPHMALFYGTPGPVNIRKVLAAVKKVGENYNLVPFRINGFDWHDGKHGKVIAASINASLELKNLRQDLAKELCKHCEPSPFDIEPDFWFHSTIAFRDIDQKFDRVWHHLVKNEKLSINQHLLRITVLNKNQKIKGEYDLLLQRWLSRWQVTTPGVRGYWWRRTINRLEELRGLPQGIKQSIVGKIFNFVKRILAKKTIYLIGDTHFNHKNIMKYTHRNELFHDVQEMDETMVRNWNGTIKAEDTVYFLGDYTGPPGRLEVYYKKLRDLTSQLKGNKISILGNHDRKGGCIKFASSKVLHYKKHTFLLIHDPKQVNNWHNWVI
ncbi:MAG: 2'-5' RNA ligase family protein, partial [Chloroflexi bacterium]|nr:2'-5' RNA ligase family protein [Chloroflexota bacterium]